MPKSHASFFSVTETRGHILCDTSRALSKLHACLHAADQCFQNILTPTPVKGASTSHHPQEVLHAVSMQHKMGPYTLQVPSPPNPLHSSLLLAHVATHLLKSFITTTHLRTTTARTGQRPTGGVPTAPRPRPPSLTHSRPPCSASRDRARDQRRRPSRGCEPRGRRRRLPRPRSCPCGPSCGAAA